MAPGCEEGPNMKVNMTATHDVILSMSASQLKHFDIISVSVDSERFNTPAQAVDFVDRVLTHFEENRWMGFFNVNLTYSVEVFEWVKDPSFIKRLDRRADRITHLMMKPLDLRLQGAFDELFAETFELSTSTSEPRQHASTPSHAHHIGLSQCYATEAEHRPHGQFSGCVFDTTKDVSTVGNSIFPQTWLGTRAPVGHCALVQ